MVSHFHWLGKTLAYYGIHNLQICSVSLYRSLETQAKGEEVKVQLTSLNIRFSSRQLFTIRATH
jgi:hypothetical protein